MPHSLKIALIPLDISVGDVGKPALPVAAMSESSAGRVMMTGRKIQFCSST